jgi:hypothetical protein
VSAVVFPLLEVVHDVGQAPMVQKKVAERLAGNDFDVTALRVMFGKGRTAAYSFCNPPKRESSMAASVKQELHQLADTLPDTATWDDVIEAAYFRRAVEAGIQAADRDVFATDKEVRTAFARWM